MDSYTKNNVFQRVDKCINEQFKYSIEELVQEHGDIWKKLKICKDRCRWLNATTKHLEWLAELYAKPCISFPEYPEEKSRRESQLVDVLIIINSRHF
jgi:hypothetical protein